jgi:hypothetical protein
VFIAFNYLLLDREKTTKNIENLQYNNDSKSASIEVLGNDIKNSKDKIDELNRNIQVLEDNNKELVKANSDLKQGEADIKDTLNKKNEIIDKLKVQIDIKPFEAIIKKWSDSIDKGQYDVAYDLYQKDDSNKDISLVDYSDNFKTNIKNIKFKSVKLQIEDANGEANGRIVFIGSFDIKLTEETNSMSYVNGINDRSFSFEYDKINDKWYISEIVSIKS